MKICDFTWESPDDATKTPIIVTDELKKQDFGAEQFVIQGMEHLICRILLHEVSSQHYDGAPVATN